ncbi:MAG: FHA domain-containing protein [Anaerolineae bacterium]|nr:FHA domain-containing protein [Anaerolineae bacterium]
MLVCANCGHLNRSGVVFCENCGTSLENTAAAGATRSFGETDVAVSEPIISAGSDHFPAGSQLRFEIEGAPEPLIIRPGQQVIFGRRDPATGAMPDVDLTPYAGYRMGVSRRHAALRLTDDEHLDVWDLGSSNGSFLNGQRLNPHQPYRLRDGDRLRLGQMVIRIIFQPPPGVLGELPNHSADTTPEEPPQTTGAPAAENNNLIETITGPALQELLDSMPPLRRSEPGQPTTRAVEPPSEDVPPAPDDKKQGDA